MEEKPASKLAPATKYNVARSEKLGRYLVAAKNLSAGEVILRESPLVVGPTAFNKDYLCFACLRLLLTVNGKVQYRCTKCNVAPLCGVACEENVGHHTTDECELLRKNVNLKSDNFMEIIGVLLPLRLWLLKTRDPSLWENVEHMEAHIDKRRGTPVWKDREINVVNVIRALKLLPREEADMGESLQRLCGILDVNTFELRSPGGLDGLLLRGLYSGATLMAHDCRGNTHLTVDDRFQLTVYASLPIAEGEPILFNYTSSLLGTAERRDHLREGKYFECECQLCKDPREMDSCLSTLLCPRCRVGHVCVQNPIASDPYARSSRWQCERCGKAYGGRLVKATLEIARGLIEQCDDSDAKQLESLTNKLSTSFHSNHYLLLSLKQKLMAAYRREVSTLNPQKKIVRKMLDLCKEVFGVLEIVEPGISRLKGIMLYEMHLPLVLLANCAHAAREISPTELVSRLQEAQGLLKKALTMLLLEPAATPEGKLAKRALQELKVLNSYIADVKAPQEDVPRAPPRTTKGSRNKKENKTVN